LCEEDTETIHLSYIVGFEDESFRGVDGGHGAVGGWRKVYQALATERGRRQGRRIQKEMSVIYVRVKKEALQGMRNSSDVVSRVMKKNPRTHAVLKVPATERTRKLLVTGANNERG